MMVEWWRNDDDGRGEMMVEWWRNDDDGRGWNDGGMMMMVEAEMMAEWWWNDDDNGGKMMVQLLIGFMIYYCILLSENFENFLWYFKIFKF